MTAAVTYGTNPLYNVPIFLFDWEDSTSLSATHWLFLSVICCLENEFRLIWLCPWFSSKHKCSPLLYLPYHSHLFYSYQHWKLYSKNNKTLNTLVNSHAYPQSNLSENTFQLSFVYNRNILHRAAHIRNMQIPVVTVTAGVSRWCRLHSASYRHSVLTAACSNRLLLRHFWL